MSNYNRVRKGVREGGQFATGARGETDVTLSHAAGTPDPVLTGALARYGLAIDDIPADHEGVHLTEHWERTRNQAQAKDAPSPAQVIDQMLGSPDYGRHRGGPEPIWWNPDMDEIEPADDPDDPRWDGPEARLAAHVHTRNGGGNRECWCEDEDDHHCLEETISALQGHKDYLHDEDDDDDATYASFYFRLPGRDEVRRALREDSAAAAGRLARRALEAIETAEAAPWEVMPKNPAAQRDAEQARAELESMGRNDLDPEAAAAIGVPFRRISAFYTRGGSYTKVDLTSQHLKDVEAVLDWAHNPEDPWPEPTAVWARGTNCLSRVATSAQAAAKAAREAIESGSGALP